MALKSPIISTSMSFLLLWLIDFIFILNNNLSIKRGSVMFEYYCDHCNVQELRFDIVPFKRCPDCGKLMFAEELEEDE